MTMSLGFRSELTDSPADSCCDDAAGGSMRGEPDASTRLEFLPAVRMGVDCFSDCDGVNIVALSGGDDNTDGLQTVIRR